MSSIGDKPASEITYREWLIGQALSSAMTMLEVRLLQNIGRHCVEYADSVLSILDGQHHEEHPNRIALDFTAVKTDGKDVES